MSKRARPDSVDNADRSDPSQWDFLEGQHLFDVAMGTDLAGVAAAARTRRDWLRQLNPYAARLLDEHPEMPTQLKAQRRQREGPAVLGPDIGPILQVRCIARVTRGYFINDDGTHDSFPSEKIECEWMPWFEWLDMVAELSRAPLFTARALDAFEWHVNMNFYALLALLGKLDDMAPTRPVGALLLRTAARMDTDKEHMPRFQRAFDFVVSKATSTWQLRDAFLAQILAECESLAQLTLFYDIFYKKMHWSEQRSYKVEDARALMLFTDKLLSAYNNENTPRTKTLLAFGSFLARLNSIFPVHTARINVLMQFVYRCRIRMYEDMTKFVDGVALHQLIRDCLLSLFE